MVRSSLFRLSALPRLFFLAGLMIAVPGQAQSTSDLAPRDSALVRVDELRQAGRFQEALSQLDSLRNEYGTDVAVLWRQSLTQVDVAKTLDKKDERSPHYQQALELANAALAADTTNAHAHLAKAVAEGRIALDAGTRERVQRSRAVKQHADRAIELDDTLPGAFHTRARWNREVSDLNFFERAIVKTVYGGLPEASFEASVEDFQRAIELENVRFHHLELAKTYLKMDRPADATAELQTVLELPAKEPFDEQYKTEAQELLEELD
jgi:tetratricopeptide (TPR) repeat protein